MLLERLREQVVQVGLEALARGIVHGTAGNMSIRDPETGLIAISPSGIPYPTVTPADVVVVNDRGEVVDGQPQAQLRNTAAHHGDARSARYPGHRPHAFALLDGRLLHPALPAADPDRDLPGGRPDGCR